MLRACLPKHTKAELGSAPYSEITYLSLQRFSGRLKVKGKCVKVLVEVQSTMTSNYIDAAVYLCYIGSCHS